MDSSKSGKSMQTIHNDDRCLFSCGQPTLHLAIALYSPNDKRTMQRLPTEVKSTAQLPYSTRFTLILGFELLKILLWNIIKALFFYFSVCSSVMVDKSLLLIFLIKEVRDCWLAPNEYISAISRTEHINISMRSRWFPLCSKPTHLVRCAY